MIRKHIPNARSPQERRRILTALSAVLFGFEVIGAVAFAVAITAIVSQYTGFYPAVAVAGAFTFTYGYAGIQLIDMARQ